MAGFELLTVEEMRDILVEEYNYSREEAEGIKGKKLLGIELVKNKYEVHSYPVEDNFFQNLEIDTPSSTGGTTSEDKPAYSIPHMGEPEWEDYVLAHLTEKELFEKDGKLFPKAHGLRRVCEQLIGDIVESGPVNVIAPTTCGGLDRAIVIYEVKISWNRSYVEEFRDISQDDIRTFREAADASVGNTPELFLPHLVATASTRAEGRCFKKALQLSIHTAEEMINDKVSNEAVERLSNGEFKDNAPISGTQISTITKLCKKHNIDMLKFINHVYPDKTELEGLISSDGSALCSLLAKFQMKGKDHVDIPEEIKIQTVKE